MKAKSDKREARMTAKKEAIKGLQNDEEAEGLPEAITDNAPAEQSGKAEKVTAPAIAKAKTTTPRKEQGA